MGTIMLLGSLVILYDEMKRGRPKEEDWDSKPHSAHELSDWHSQNFNGFLISFCYFLVFKSSNIPIWL